ncbi:DNA/RNA non-specific endonuclease [Comamonas aquatica]|uniref:DNA/RNA non-specific endonuclease n=1 Tax=Comamonas aquatica TaxID=225991 RepID=UPI003C7E2B73
MGAALLTACLGNSPTASQAPAPARPGSAAPAPAAQATRAGFQDCRQFFAAGQPPAVATQPKLRDLCYDAFAILHNGNTRTPMFVAQRMNRSLVDDADEKRTNKFFADARLPRAERAELNDYKGSGYSRGHMAPAADMPTAQAMAQSFSLANMVPQSIKQNSGPWARIEKDTRHYASRAQGDVFIITGPVYEGQPDTVGDNHVAVPSYLYKLVYDASTNRAWAHWQANRDDARVSKPISYAELVQRTGIDFLPGVHPQ